MFARPQGHNRLGNLPFSRFFSAIVIANFLTLALMNLLELPVSMAVFVFLGATAGRSPTGQPVTRAPRPRGAWTGRACGSRWPRWWY